MFFRWINVVGLRSGACGAACYPKQGRPIHFLRPRALRPGTLRPGTLGSKVSRSEDRWLDQGGDFLWAICHLVVRKQGQKQGR